ncbi:Cytochrome P450 [Mycena indigotica]|uniref:Cytochrome P450 n=1 Tax=Mycena indigotica TaxID=2126181 RepID=A0A8H6S382_9AGAR|nr:Cytochrome P450 [Mycena indigotica]KAF7292084.1 Cytochrome P450 [Mycena indigotica]
MAASSATVALPSILVSPMALLSVAILGMLTYLAPLLFRKQLRGPRDEPLPPGPLFRRLWLGQYNELVFDKWARAFGPLYSVWFGDQLIVVLSHPRVAQDLLVENGAVFSSRKDYYVKNEVILHDRAITANPYDQRWRDHRNTAMRFLSERAVAGYSDAIESEVVTLLRSLYDESNACAKPVTPALSAVRFTLNNMLRVSFGQRTTSLEDALLHRIQRLVMEFDDITSPTSNAIDFVKPLRWFPTRTYKRAAQLNAEMNDQYGSMIAAMQERLDNGEADAIPECAIKHILQNEAWEHEDVLMLAVAFAFGGVHSIAGILQWFIAFMATHPAVAAAAHAELDQVVGRDRLPTNEDEKDLPYIRAIIKEVQRIHSPFWVPTPHYSTADFVYNGMFIPKGTVVILNCWTMHHDETRYPDSYTFNPERYLGDDLSSSASSKLRDPMARDHWAFGAGRRICPGFAIAEREIWLAVSGMLWYGFILGIRISLMLCFSRAYNFAQVPGAPISLAEYEGSSGRTPLPFEIQLQLRHTKAREIIENHEGWHSL